MNLMSDFASRQIGIQPEEQKEMLEKLGIDSIEKMIEQTIPADIHLPKPLDMAPAMSEGQFAEHINDLASRNKIFTSYIGSGWYDTFTPAVIQRNVFENPVWYTSYTPYQAEVSQGRLEALFNFQTVITELTGLPLTNASLLDDATAAAEAANMFFNMRSKEQETAGANILFIDQSVFSQTLAVLNTRCIPQGIKLEIGDYATFKPNASHFAALVQYPNADGQVENYAHFITKMHQAGLKVAVAADILSLCLLQSPGNWGADVVFGSTQHFGIPMGFGGPSAGYFATKDEYKRNIPGRIIGLSKDKSGRPAYRLALQMREQHIKREKATSNICTASALMANMAGFYAVYHGYEGLRDMAKRIHGIASYLNDALSVYGYKQANDNFFDTLKISLPKNVKLSDVKRLALEYEVNFRYFETGEIGISIDETTDHDDVDVLLDIFASAAGNQASFTNNEDFTTI
ncbi:MAG: glycine dehydrogenase (aminomethyl-transferring), partial [Bacteroidales bacterium]